MKHCVREDNFREVYVREKIMSLIIEAVIILSDNVSGEQQLGADLLSLTALFLLVMTDQNGEHFRLLD